MNPSELVALGLIVNAAAAIARIWIATRPQNAKDRRTSITTLAKVLPSGSRIVDIEDGGVLVDVGDCAEAGRDLA